MEHKIFSVRLRPIISNNKKIMTIITASRKLINNVKKNNKESNLVKELKAFNSFLRLRELSELIKRYPLGANQLKAVLFLFPQEDRYSAFKLLVKHFDINLSVLPDSEIKQLSVCLERDPAFNKLLPFEKKNFGIISSTKQNTNSINTRQNNSQLPSKKANSRKAMLQDLRLSLIKKDPALRLSFFKSLETKNVYQSLATRMNVEELKNFIELFPPNDAIKFLNLPFISDQIEGLQWQNGQLSKESYIDLLNYFKPCQKDSVKKLLRPISANIDTRLLQRGIFKEKIIPKTEQLNKLPDIVASHTHGIARTR